MLCSTKDQFQKGAQVFFCYGRLPNKLLLMRYGFALEHNKYDHMFLKIDITEQVINDPYLRTVLEEINIRKYKRFKLKRTKFCIELLAYLRSEFWAFGQPIEHIFTVASTEREIKVLEKAKEIYVSKIGEYSKPLQQNQKQLLNPKLGYHEYFALVYKIEQQRILKEQISMIHYAKQVISKIEEGATLKAILLA